MFALRETAMSIHVAILKKPLLDQVLAGQKTVESRLTKTLRPPYGQIERGQRIYLKASGGPFMALARAGTVQMLEHLTPRRLEQLQAAYNDRVCGDQAYWQSRRDCRFGVFIELTEMEPIHVGPVYPRLNMVAWHVLDDNRDPIRDVPLTGANLRNHYVRIEGISEKLRNSPVTLTMPDGRVVQTDFARGSMLRWRGWGEYFRKYALEPGDIVRFTHVDENNYQVGFPNAPSTRPAFAGLAKDKS